jgi:DNA-binding LytR/AlgR family response regulator
MKVSIRQEKTIEHLEAVILCQEHTLFVDQLAKKISQISAFIIGKDSEGTVQLSLDDVYYFEAVENRTYIYCREHIYNCKMKLYELESKLTGMTFQRISKSCILNLDKIKKAKGMINGRLTLELDNNEKLIVNRSYVAKLKDYVKSLYQ